MNRKLNIAGAIEKNRVAILRLVFCWLAAAHCLTLRGDKPLPRRLARYISGLICAAEKATGYLLIAVFYRGQIKKCRAPDFEKAAMQLIASNKRITLGELTVAGIIKRLKALHRTLHNLHATVRQLAKSLAAHARVLAMKSAAMVTARGKKSQMPCQAITLKDVIPP